MKKLLIEEEISSQPSPCSRSKQYFLHVVWNIIYPICITAPTITIAVACWNNGMGSFYSWHLLLTALCFHLIMPIGITSLRVQPVLPYRFCTRKTIHWLLQSVASACVLLGVVLQYISREMKHKRHIDTVHSIVGLISVVLVAVSLASGVAALLGWQWRKYLKTVWLYRVHRAVGAAGFLAGLVALALAYEKRIFTDHFSEATRLALTIATSVTGMLSLWGVLKKSTITCASAAPSDHILNDSL